MDDQNGNVIVNKTAPPLQDPGSSDPSSQKSNRPDSLDLNSHENKEDFTFGWGKFRPKSLKFLSSPVWFIVVFSVYNTFQGIAAWGLPSLVLPSIERRFGFSAKELGLISASNDVTALVLVLFISYYGDYGNKIKWMAGGAVTTGIGVIVFALPHFMIGRYHPGSSQSDSLCGHGNRTMTQCSDSGGDWYYLTVFIVAMLIMGIGSAPYFSLFNAYLDENVEPKSFPLYLGVFTIIQFTAPGVGFAIGGKFLSIYVDINQPYGFNLTPQDPRWIGAWWLGFLIFGVLIILCSFVMFGFPREMPGARERRLKHIRAGNIKPSNDVKQPSLRKIPSELKELLKNLTFLFNVLGVTCLLFYVGALLVFFPKILRMKFGIDAVKAGYIIAIISISGTVLGNISGSMIVRIFSLKTTCKKAAAACMICQLLASGGTLMFLIPSCVNTNLAGVAVDYHDYSHMNVTESLKSQCNVKCDCSLKSLSPVCGSDNVTYLDACHAGCTAQLSDKTFANCSCISSQDNSAKPGYCDRDCKNLVIFTVIAVIAITIRSSSNVPARIVMLRCVPDNKRAFASGVWYVSLKTFGLLPSPVVFGHIVDESCRLWQNICGERGRCFDYDVNSLSRNIAFYGFTVSVLTTFCYFLSWYFCKPCTESVCIQNQGVEEHDETHL